MTKVRYRAARAAKTSSFSGGEAAQTSFNPAFPKLMHLLSFCKLVIGGLPFKPLVMSHGEFSKQIMLMLQLLSSMPFKKPDQLKLICVNLDDTPTNQPTYWTRLPMRLVSLL